MRGNRLHLQLKAIGTDGSHLCVEVRHGRDAADSEPATVRLPGDLIARCTRLQQQPVSRFLKRDAIGIDLWNALAPAVPRLPTYAQQPLRLVLELCGDRALRAINFELLRRKADQVATPHLDHAPIESARWQLERRSGPEPRAARDGHGGRIRVLVLVGSQLQPGDLQPADYVAADAVLHVRTALTCDGSPFDVAIHAAEGMLGPLGDRRIAAQALCSPDDVAAALRDGGGHDIVLFLGHSDAAPADAGKVGATALCFDFLDATGKPVQTPVAITTVRDALANTRTRLVVLQCCLSREGLAEALLDVVDDVVGMQAMLPVLVTPVWCGAFFAAIAKNHTVAEAVRQMRAAFDESRGVEWPDWVHELAWVPAHWTAVHAPVPFRDESRRFLRDYCQRVARAHADLHGGLLDAKYRGAVEQVPVEVLVAHTREQTQKDGRQRAERTLEMVDDARERMRAGRAAGLPTLATLLDEPKRRFAVLGRPGAGKTTSMRELARRLANTAEQRIESALVPVFVRLRQFTDGRGTGAPPILQELLQYALLQLAFAKVMEGGKAAVLDDPGRHGLAVLEVLGVNGRLVLLLDGLDEVADRHRDTVQQVLQQLDASWPGCPVLLTSRPFGFELPHGSLRQAEFLPLGERQQRELLRNWLQLEQAPDPDRIVDNALEQIGKSPALQELAGTPLFLVLLAKQLGRGLQVQELATRRHAFFDQVIKFLLLGKHKPASLAKELAPFDTAREVLGWIAWHQVRNFTIAMRRHDLMDLLQKASGSQPWLAAGGWRDWGEFLHAAADRTLLLRPSDTDGTDQFGLWEFLHRSLMEALAAWHLAHTARDAIARRQLLDELEQDIAREAEARQRDGDARASAHTSDAVRSLAESLALATGWLGADADGWIAALLARPPLRRTGIEAVALAEALLPATLQDAFARCEDLDERVIVYTGLGERGERAAIDLLAARARKIPRQWQELYHIDQCLLRIAARLPGLAADVARATDALFAGCPETTDAQLVEAFSWVPGKPGKPGEPGEQLWCEIPAGTFRMGSPADEPRRRNDEGPFRTEIPARYWIGAVTVTLGQFRLFDPGHWHRWGDDGNVPVTRVTWFAATMFCRWLSWRAHALRLPGLPERWHARLPHEAEWERAARAGTASAFWCGAKLSEDVARYGLGWDGGPAASGSRRRCNDYGLYDVHGNVYEWCADWYGQYPSAGEDEVIGRWRGARSGRFRVLRGGSYGSDAANCRSAYRGGVEPGRTFDDFGFRVVVSAPEPIMEA